MELMRSNTFNNDIVFIDGPSSSGKALISRILEYYDGVEKQTEGSIFYLISEMYQHKLINKNIASNLLKISTDRLFYNLAIGRDINFKPSDNSSVFKYPYPLDYMKRALRNTRNDARRFVESNYPMYQIISHNVLTNIELYEETFEDRLKVVYMIRNPIDIIYGMEYNSNYGNRITEDPAFTRLSINYKNNDIPFFAIDYKEKYIKMNPIDRMILWLYKIWSDNIDKYDNITESTKDKIVFVEFEKLVTNPYPICEDISNFIGRKSLHRLRRVLKKENCFRMIDEKGISKCECIIREDCSKEGGIMLDKLNDMYNNKWWGT